MAIVTDCPFAWGEIKSFAHSSPLSQVPAAKAVEHEQITTVRLLTCRDAIKDTAKRVIDSESCVA